MGPKYLHNARVEYIRNINNMSTNNVYDYVPGITGEVAINEYGHRTSNFSIHNIRLGIYRDVAVSNGR